MRFLFRISPTNLSFKVDDDESHRALQSFAFASVGNLHISQKLYETEPIFLFLVDADLCLFLASADLATQSFPHIPARVFWHVFEQQLISLTLLGILCTSLPHTQHFTIALGFLWLTYPHFLLHVTLRLSLLLIGFPQILHSRFFSSSLCSFVSIGVLKHLPHPDLIFSSMCFLAAFVPMFL